MKMIVYQNPRIQIKTLQFFANPQILYKQITKYLSLKKWVSCPCFTCHKINRILKINALLAVTMFFPYHYSSNYKIFNLIQFNSGYPYIMVFLYVSNKNFFSRVYICACINHPSLSQEGVSG